MGFTPPRVLSCRVWRLVTEDLVNHGQAAVSATLFQGWSSQVLDHSGGMAITISVACDIPGRVTLDLFKLVGRKRPIRVKRPMSNVKIFRQKNWDVRF